MTQSDCEEHPRNLSSSSDEAILKTGLLRPLALAKGGQTIAIRLIGARNDTFFKIAAKKVITAVEHLLF